MICPKCGTGTVIPGDKSAYCSTCGWTMVKKPQEWIEIVIKTFHVPLLAAGFCIMTVGQHFPLREAMMDREEWNSAINR